jgi:hypothetical protein
MRFPYRDDARNPCALSRGARRKPARTVARAIEFDSDPAVSRTLLLSDFSRRITAPDRRGIAEWLGRGQRETCRDASRHRRRDPAGIGFLTQASVKRVGGFTSLEEPVEAGNGAVGRPSDRRHVVRAGSPWRADRYSTNREGSCRAGDSIRTEGSYRPTRIFRRTSTPPRLCSLNAVATPPSKASGTCVYCTSIAVASGPPPRHSTPPSTW